VSYIDLNHQFDVCYCTDIEQHLESPILPGYSAGWADTVGQEFHFSQDANGVVYFTSTRPGGYGGMDIWGAQQPGVNEWETAFTLGPKNNTSAADKCPALPPGGNTMIWLSSRQDNNLGNFDIFWTNMSNFKIAAP